MTVDQYSLGCSKAYWESPCEFLPERWIELQGAIKNQNASRPFLIGSRQCPGRSLVLQLLRLVVGKMVYLYKMELINEDFELDGDSSSCLSWTNIALHVAMKPRVPDILGYQY